MLTSQKITELLSQKYNSNISLLGNYLSSNYSSILDVNNGTLFIVSNALLFSFQDEYSNFWLTVVKSFHANGKLCHPKVGELYHVNDGVNYHFTTKEVIVEMAVAYFEKHLRIN